jgi:hypothetical protein
VNTASIGTLTDAPLASVDIVCSLYEANCEIYRLNCVTLANLGFTALWESLKLLTL